MSTYQAPIADMLFVMEEIAGLQTVAALPGYEEASRDTVVAILEEANKFAAHVLAPINSSGDRQGSRWSDGQVKTPEGFKDAYKQFVEAGWNGLNIDPQWGGQGLPSLVNTAVEEMWDAANISFALCPLLTHGAIEALQLCGTAEQKQALLHKMVSGEWTGTMNLTEPQAGSDLAAVKTRAVPQGDGSYKLYGQKIFITYGEHDLTDNIIHLVLARTPTAPEGVKGISLFVVPKFLINQDGSLGSRNDVHCVSIEHKLGIHASPTAVLTYGDKGGAVGYLVGEENRGLEYMFIMMNAARFAVGLEGIGLSERAYQRAAAYAKERVQGKAVGVSGKAGAIIQHPDVRRMLLSMRAQTEAMRALALVTAAAMDHARKNPDPQIRKEQQAFVELLIPIVKGWCTETAQQVTYDGVQVHGGMGFIEETGAAQYYRDARIVTIYEGTTGIQANDLVGRKIVRDNGKTALAVIAKMRQLCTELSKHNELATLQRTLTESVLALQTATEWVISEYTTNPRAVFAQSVPLLKLWGIVAGGWLMVRAALAAKQKLAAAAGDRAFLEAKIVTARFYVNYFLSQAQAMQQAIMTSGVDVLAFAEEQF